MVFLALLLSLASPWALSALPQGPSQAVFGPGSSDYQHATVRGERFNQYEDTFFLFEPASPTPASAPVLIFLHGWMTSDPGYYRAWIDHLCRRGWIVIFPRYQGTGQPMRQFTTNVIRSVKEAFKTLYEPGHVAPDRDRVAIIGHQCGAVIGANIAAGSRYYKIPWPRALFLVMPSRGSGLKPVEPIEVFNLSAIQEGTLMLVISGDTVDEESAFTAREIFHAADRVRSQDKNFLTLLSDTHGTPPLVADSWAPLAPVEAHFTREIQQRRNEYVLLARQHRLARHIACQAVDALDWNGTFRLFDALAGVAFANEPRGFALGNTPAQRDMGQWSDGRPINRPFISDRP